MRRPEEIHKELEGLFLKVHEGSWAASWKAEEEADRILTEVRELVYADLKDMYEHDGRCWICNPLKGK